jgi:DnaJ domain
MSGKDFDDYYLILGVNPDASQKEIKEARNYRVHILHTDHLEQIPESHQRRAEEELKNVNQAFYVLKDPQRRQEYHSEWLRQRVRPKETFVPKPKPVVDPEHIYFRNVNPGEIQTASFVVKNIGGSYTKIWISNPDSWVMVVRWASQGPDDELPLRVEIEAKGEDWGKSHSEYIWVKLDEEEVRVKIELQTKPEPVNLDTTALGIKERILIYLPKHPVLYILQEQILLFSRVFQNPHEYIEKLEQARRRLEQAIQDKEERKLWAIQARRRLEQAIRDSKERKLWAETAFLIGLYGTIIYYIIAVAIDSLINNSGIILTIVYTIFGAIGGFFVGIFVGAVLGIIVYVILAIVYVIKIGEGELF